ncbi:MAG: class II aldolase/adducin family protein [SAR324 cluster bacterium]|uniref:Class II aldolase/adducin family protein n=1 Tax=SAR324 cluster bacterium TaxID=2024889 RepID=A0A7X9FT03_9DELT|nr:class II aldolase/adducin family protein [SAR324 cluster bacterium]
MEGYVKFRCVREDAAPLKESDVRALNHLRAVLRKPELNLLGETSVTLDTMKGPEKVGFGNVSCRASRKGSFIISGTRTGGYNVLLPEQYVLVDSYDIEANTLYCRGRIDASSESLSHAAIYEARNSVKIIAHIHSLELWRVLTDSKHRTSQQCPPLSDPSAKYGTPEIAKDIKHKLLKDENNEYNFIILGGHEEGFMFFHETADGILLTISKVFNEFLSWPIQRFCI